MAVPLTLSGLEANQGRVPGRYLHVRLLLVRPVLSAFVSLDKVEGAVNSANQSILSHQIILQCSLLCIRLAHQAINVVYEKRSGCTEEIGTLSAWWYNVLFLYTSATVLIAARLSPSILTEIPESTVMMWWKQAMEALPEYTAFGSTVQHALTTLQVLFNTVPRQFLLPQRVSADHGVLGQRPQLMGAGADPRYEDGRERGPSTSISATAPQVDAAEPELDSLFLEAEDFLAFDASLGPNDMSWLTTTPFI